MFRSVFSRLVLMFTVIIVTSFTLLTVVIVNITNSYSKTIKTESLNNISDIASNVISVELEHYPSDDPNDNGLLLRYSDILSALINYSDIHAFVVNDEGKVLISDKSFEKSIEGLSIPDTVLELFDEDGYTGNLSIPGVFDYPVTVSGHKLNSIHYSKALYILAFSANLAEYQFISSLMKTMILSTMWILIAILIAVLFFSDRIISPLRQISRATKEFASGHLDVRVEVSGNDEISDLGRSFNKMAESLADLEKMRSSFLGNLSHDLRTPMTTISGFIDGILDGTIPAEKQNQYLSIVSTEVKRLSRLVTEILDLSRIQAGERKFTPSKFDVCEMARLIIISFESKINEKNLNVTFDSCSDNVYVYADSDSIYQVLYNVIDNAIKFTPQERMLKVSVNTASNAKIEVVVYNEGEGIAEEDLPFIFDRFYKTDKSRSKDKNGAGLGMYIAKSILEAQGEHIEVNSVFGEYCEFRFSLKKA